MAALHFSCTSCGRCCHGLRLTLSVDEATAWALRGGIVQILCHAAPDVRDGSEDAEYKHQRRFSARSGDLSIWVQVILVAQFEGACPNLLPDMRCGIYDERPNVCRVYPAEIIPGRTVDPSNRLCPPEAWRDREPAFLLNDGSIADAVTRSAIEAARAAGIRELAARRSLVTSLGIDVAALENEGFAVWTINSDRLVDALRTAAFHSDHDEDDRAQEMWSFISLRAETAALISSVGARVSATTSRAELDYLPLY